jgi:chromosome segregation ATPase
MSEEHPSLNLDPKLTSKTATETLNKFQTEVQQLKETLNDLKTQTSSISEEFSNLDALQVLASIESKIDNFIQRYESVLAKAEANLDLEKEALNNLKSLAGKI